MVSFDTYVREIRYKIEETPKLLSNRLQNKEYFQVINGLLIYISQNLVSNDGTPDWDNKIDYPYLMRRANPRQIKFPLIYSSKIPKYIKEPNNIYGDFEDSYHLNKVKRIDYIYIEYGFVFERVATTLKGYDLLKKKCETFDFLLTFETPDDGTYGRFDNSCYDLTITNKFD